MIDDHGNDRYEFEMERCHQYHYYMRKKRVILSVLAGVVLLACVYTGYRYATPARTQSPWSGYEAATYHIYGNTYTVLVADTPAKQTKGLMNVRKADGFDGMVFRFPTAETQYFWNEDTYVDPDLYWMRKGNIVGKSFLPSIEKSGQIIVNSPEPVDEAVEIIRK